MIKITKVTEIYFVENAQEAASSTGLYIKLEDGRVLRHQSTDCVMPFEEPAPDSEVLSALYGKGEKK